MQLQRRWVSWGCYLSVRETVNRKLLPLLKRFQSSRGLRTFARCSDACVRKCTLNFLFDSFYRPFISLHFEVFTPSSADSVYSNNVLILLHTTSLFSWVLNRTGAWNGLVVKALRQYSEGFGIGSSGVAGDFFLKLPTEPCALGSTQPLKMSTRKTPGGKDGRCVGVTTLPPS